MPSLPGAQLSITGASGSQGLLSPKAGWKAIVLPRGAHAAQDSTGVNITLDSDEAANRFAVDNWLQVGLSTSKIRKVTLVGSGNVRVNSAVTVAENERIYLIGSTQPTVSGGSATYIQPASVIRQRDDAAADIYANSLVTSNSDGLIQFWSEPALFDCIIQDGNGSNQGSIIDLAVGAVEGISTSSWSVFGATVTVNANVVITGTLTVGQTTTLHGALGTTGWATFGSTVTIHGALGVTGAAVFSSTALVGATATVNGSLGVTGAITGATATLTGLLTGTSGTFSNDINMRRPFFARGTTLASTDFTLSSGWGVSASIFKLSVGSRDSRGEVGVVAFGAGITDNPIVYVNFKDGTFSGTSAFSFANRSSTTAALAAPTSGFWCPLPIGTTQAGFRFQGLPVDSSLYLLKWLVIG